MFIVSGPLSVAKRDRASSRHSEVRGQRLEVGGQNIMSNLEFRIAN